MEVESQPHKRYICSFPSCSAAYNKQWKLDAHLCKHTGVKPHACAHDGCGKSFCSAYHLARHELTHSGLKPFSCTVDGCTDAPTTNANRVRHISRAHTQEPRKYMCTFEGCGLQFKKNKLLKSHMCEQHTQLPAYQCTHEGCKMRFTCPSKLKRHEKVHRGYPCQEEGCTFAGNTWTEFLKHRQEQHRPRVSCHQCSKVFRDSWSLQQHQQIHSSTRVVFKCPRNACERSFTSTSSLQSHIRSFHEELRPFTCTHAGCGKTFTMKQSLQRHGILHDPERKKQRRPRPRRSLASRLSGCSDKKGFECESLRGPGQKKPDPPGPVELVSLLQDTALLGMDAHGLADAMTTPLTV